MLRKVHSLPGLVAALLVAFMALTGAVLSVNPLMTAISTPQAQQGRLNVAALAEAVQVGRQEVDKIEVKASGAVVVTFYRDGRAAAELVDPVTGKTIGPYETSAFTRFMTDLHRSLLLGDAGRIVAGVSAAAMLLLSLTGVLMLASRMGGWRGLLHPMRGMSSQRLHAEAGRLAMIGLLITGLSGSYMSLANFSLIPDGAQTDMDAPEVNGGKRLPLSGVTALVVADVAKLRDLTFPYGDDLADVYTLTTDTGTSQIDAATGEQLTFEPHGLTRQIYEFIFMLHTGEGLWPLALMLGLSALAVPLLGYTGVLTWWQRYRARPRIGQNAGAALADTIILVGSQSNTTWGFAVTLKDALIKNGHKVHVAEMNQASSGYANAQRLLILTSTYGEGAAPETASRFLERLDRFARPLPFAVLGFGDRSFAQFCQFAQDVDGALDQRKWPRIMELESIDRQSSQTFADWGRALGVKLGHPLELTHVPSRPHTRKLVLVERQLYGVEVAAPTAILRFRAEGTRESGGWLAKLLPKRLPDFEAGDLVGILPPGSDVARFYSLASSAADGTLDICVRLQTGGLCSGFLHSMPVGASIDMFIRKNPTFRPSTSKKPLILIGAGAGIGPLAGFIRQNSSGRPVHLYWGGRNPSSDFLYRDELARHLVDKKLTGLHTAFSRLPGGFYVQDRLNSEAAEVRSLIESGAQIMVCGGRDMARSVKESIGVIIEPAGLDVSELKASGHYLEDVY